jgi:hypothetical protein
MMIRQRSFRIGQRVKLHDSTIEGGNAYGQLRGGN